MVTATNEYEASYERLRSGMIRSARRSGMIRSARRSGIHVDDVEDVVHDALVKMLGEHVRSGAPSLERRAHAVLRDKRAEHWRREHRRSARLTSLNLPPGEAGYEQERPEMAKADPAPQLLELRDLIESIAGRDATLFALLKACGATESDIVILLGWTPARAAAARIQLGRKKALIAHAVTDALTEEEG